MGFAAIIPAAGRSERMKSSKPKVLLEAHSGQSVVRRTVEIFHDHPACTHVIVAAPARSLNEVRDDLCGLAKVTVIVGGETRQESVHLSVRHLVNVAALPPHTSVLVHDAARCCIGRTLIDRVLDEVVKGAAVTAAVPVVDAMVRSDGSIVETEIDRSETWLVQTPQGFSLSDLLKAHDDARKENLAALDDASLVRRHRPVRIVTGDRFNIKVTTPTDLQLTKDLIDNGLV